MSVKLNLRFLWLWRIMAMYVDPNQRSRCDEMQLSMYGQAFRRVDVLFWVTLAGNSTSRAAWSFVASVDVTTFAASASLRCSYLSSSRCANWMSCNYLTPRSRSPTWAGRNRRRTAKFSHPSPGECGPTGMIAYPAPPSQKSMPLSRSSS